MKATVASARRLGVGCHDYVELHIVVITVRSGLCGAGQVGSGVVGGRVRGYSP